MGREMAQIIPRHLILAFHPCAACIGDRPVDKHHLH